VDFAPLQPLHPRGVFLDRHPNQAIDLRPAVPVVVVGRADELPVAGPADECERTRAHRLIGKPAPIFFERGGADDAGRKHGQVGQQNGARVVQVQDDARLVRRLHFADHVVARLVRPGLVERQRVVGHDQAVEARLYRLGIQGRAIVKPHPLAKVKGPRQAIVRDLPPRGQRGHDLGRFVVIGDQRVEQIRDDVDRLGDVGVDRIESLGVLGLGVDQRACGNCRAAVAAGDEQQADCHTGPGQDCGRSMFNPQLPAHEIPWLD
jgi:hypothetical protein